MGQHERKVLVNQLETIERLMALALKRLGQYENKDFENQALTTSKSDIKNFLRQINKLLDYYDV